MLIEVDLAAPLGSLKAQGVVCNVTQLVEPSTLTLGGLSVAIECAHGLRFDFVLPERTPVQFVLAPEHARHRFFKLFSAEPQVHDAAFDAAVFITTDQPALLTAWLADADLRALILIVVGGGGELVAQSQRLVVVVPHAEGQTEADAALVAAALAAALVNFSEA